MEDDGNNIIGRGPDDVPFGHLNLPPPPSHWDRRPPRSDNMLTNRRRA